ncbi:MAG: SigB/SigF/SigG family RNA polymerase sigma factor [Oscillospiraceae bacterium]|nr:SigB/SigF/SigG family RNA polymerase sigma factor [Oscillospiraceae bacterium]
MQYSKVSISSVDTSELKTLSETRTNALLAEAAKGTRNARDELIRGNLRLVLSVVQRFSSRGENPDDVFQVGCIGLIKAVDHFDLSQGVRFSTYAVPMIIGEIRRYLRDNNPVRVSRSMRDTAYHAMLAKEELTAKEGREPTVEEIAEKMGLPRQKVIIALESVSDPVSLSEPVYTDSGDAVSVADRISGGTEEKDWLDEMYIRDALEALSPREKQILNSRFLDGKTQTEVANEIGISQAQVSRLEKCAIGKIKGE